MPMTVLKNENITRIHAMPDFMFWSREPIGATDADCEAAAKGELTPERSEQLAVLGLAAREKLAQMPVPGYQEWMSSRRAMN